MKKKNAIFPIEAKLNFGRFNSRTIDYFIDEYGIESYRVVGLDGGVKNKFYIYPWQL